MDLGSQHHQILPAGTKNQYRVDWCQWGLEFRELGNTLNPKPKRTNTELIGASGVLGLSINKHTNIKGVATAKGHDTTGSKRFRSQHCLIPAGTGTQERVGVSGLPGVDYSTAGSEPFASQHHIILPACTGNQQEPKTLNPNPKP